MIGRSWLERYRAAIKARKYGQWRLPLPVCLLILLAISPGIGIVVGATGQILVAVGEALGVRTAVAVIPGACAVLVVVYVLAQLVYLIIREPAASEGRFCINCGYDLTGNVSGRCPECGETHEMNRPGSASGESDF